ncbi:hypothetical protein BP5796_09288 [Coleophoma crateriformis]|uniref:Amidohydrolase-related domain-containing protein n=1 Tax=Coleophoma crateriformis TaxID=565419 RepID=A0A3D8R3X9_9HELO|nr:hypothetical protein BP5796_09288 [Coleophoma crateriformis]
MSGEEMNADRLAERCYFTDDETAACVDEVHRHGIRVCGHARAHDAVKMCVKHGVHSIYHASWIDDETIDMLDAAKSKHIAAPAVGVVYAGLHESSHWAHEIYSGTTIGIAKLFMQEDSFGKIQPVYYADCIWVDGNPLGDNKNYKVMNAIDYDRRRFSQRLPIGRSQQAASTSDKVDKEAAFARR